MAEYKTVDVREVWDIILPGLEEIKSQTNPPWRLEDVYAACVSGTAHIYMDPQRTRAGFLILQSVLCPFRRISKLLLWIAHDPVGGSATEYALWVEKLAKETGHQEIEIMTPHEGLWRLAEKFGYKMQWAVLTKEVK